MAWRGGEGGGGGGGTLETYDGVELFLENHTHFYDNDMWFSLAYFQTLPLNSPPTPSPTTKSNPCIVSKLGR